ncbi:hypothetical protein BU16DRAFT_523367 [Lophium mytilinum]|uniref:Uncharacterized protein n=1 Tax=Lophium mytilinum TaxID=390894 RepID=A0A6A6R9W6_9PEZI|nr:hypothetical protein BU16DRAFT_523367 [Lophium mytilinum]
MAQSSAYPGLSFVNSATSKDLELDQETDSGFSHFERSCLDDEAPETEDSKSNVEEPIWNQPTEDIPDPTSSTDCSESESDSNLASDFQVDYDASSESLGIGADTPWVPSGPFRFLDLPRELRDNVYAELLTSENLNTRGTYYGYDNCRLHVWDREDAKRLGRVWQRENESDESDESEGSSVSSNHHTQIIFTAIMRTSKQIHVEAKKALYDLNTFSIDLTRLIPRLLNEAEHPDQTLPNNYIRLADHEPYQLGDELPGGLNYNCDPSAICRLNLQLHLWDAEGMSDRRTRPGLFANRNAFVGPFDVLAKLSLQGFHQMKSLQKVRISLAYDEIGVPTLVRWCKGDGPPPMRIRSFMRDLVAAVPEKVQITWGMTNAEAQKIVEESKWKGARMEAWWGFVAGDVLRKLADEFKCLKGMDAKFADEHAFEEIEEDLNQ